MLTALGPVFAAILLGYTLSRVHFPGDEFWPHAERITYYVLFPALLINKLSSGGFGDEAVPMALAILGAGLGAGLALLALRRRLGFDGPAFTSVFQGTVRVNTYVGLAGAAALMGDSGIALSAVALLAIVSLNNLMCVPVVARYGASGNGHGLALAVELARNPLILGCVCGFAINASGLVLHPAAQESLAVIGRAALPMGLLAVGAGLRFSSMGSRAKAIGFGLASKLVAMPLATALLCALLGVTGDALTVAVLFSALPTASSSFILARQLGGDTELMASLITVQTVASVLTIPLAMALLT